MISIENCRIEDNVKLLLENVSWHFNKGEAWLVTGPNGGGKAEFLNALSGKLKFVPGTEGSYKNQFENKIAVVSLEEAARLIQEERDRDESEYMDKEDIGRTGRQYICEVLGGSSKKGAPLPAIASRLESMPEVKLCGIEKILDRGLHFMSTGEIRRTLLCRALLSKAELLILSDPFAGLDAESRRILLEFFNTITQRQLNAGDETDFPRILLCMERFKEIPESINKVLEFTDKKISFCGSRAEYHTVIENRTALREKNREREKAAFLAELDAIKKASDETRDFEFADSVPEMLLDFENVNVGWDEHRVLVNFNWQVKKGVHWLLRGPNGSGKTTILELITGDNRQVFRENIKLFGARRGSGETIWDIKKRLGIVSYRLHVEYRMVGGTTLESVIVSGFKDSIGLYEMPTDTEIALARAWLKLAGFQGREKDTFNSLSYGEQRAVLILRAAVKNPAVLILDEPCHGLDENFRQKILDLLEKVASTGTTTLLHVTHDPMEVLSCEKHVLELHPGEDPMFRIIEQ